MTEKESRQTLDSFSDEPEWLAWLKEEYKKRLGKEVQPTVLFILPLSGGFKPYSFVALCLYCEVFSF